MVEAIRVGLDLTACWIYSGDTSGDTKSSWTLHSFKDCLTKQLTLFISRCTVQTWKMSNMKCQQYFGPAWWWNSSLRCQLEVLLDPSCSCRFYFTCFIKRFNPSAMFHCAETRHYAALSLLGLYRQNDLSWDVIVLQRKFIELPQWWVVFSHLCG